MPKVKLTEECPRDSYRIARLDTGAVVRVNKRDDVELDTETAKVLEKKLGKHVEIKRGRGRPPKDAGPPPELEPSTPPEE